MNIPKKHIGICISTSEFRTGGEASSVPEEDRNLFDSNKKALWIELQAFAKDILTGLSIFHKQGTAHLEPVITNLIGNDRMEIWRKRKLGSRTRAT